jgi:hypothetical protein
MTIEVTDHFLFDKQCMIVNGFSTMDQGIVSFFKDITEPSELEEKFETILKLGVTAAKSTGMIQNVDYIQKEFNNLESKMKDVITKMLTELDYKFEGIFGDRGEFSNMLKEHFGDNGKIVKDVFDPHKEGTPLNSLRKEILTIGAEVKAQLVAGKEIEVVRQKTTLKGLDFEEYCENTLSDMARVHGDSLEITRKTVGAISKSRKGDYTITFGTNIGKKLVFEVKDVQEISLKGIHDELEEAKKNRNADYGIFVAKNVEAIPKSIGWFNEYNEGKNLVCALGNEESGDLLHGEILCIAYKWAKLKLSTESLKQKKVDITFVKEKADTILQRLNSFNQIGTQCGNIIKSAGEIKRIAAETKDGITDDLNLLCHQLQMESELVEEYGGQEAK